MSIENLPPTPTPASALRDRLRGRLTDAMRGKDRTAVRALRSLMSAIDNAEAAPLADHQVEASSVGAGSADVERLILGEADLARIVDREIADRLAAADEIERGGPAEAADELRAEAKVLREHVG
jgi:uncharacterized protein YqeY